VEASNKPAPVRSVDPRIGKTRKAVLEGASVIMIEKGVTAFTVDEVVARTGVALSTIYRHWRSRDDLLADAIVFAAQPRLLPDTGSVRSDLVEFLASRSRHRADNWGSSLQTLPGIIEAGQRSHRISEAVTEVVGRILDSIVTLLGRGRQRGEIRYLGSSDPVADLLLGAIFIRGGYRELVLSDEYVEVIVDALLHGLEYRPT
jgi:AcrR family transcriptional regulator